MRRRTIKKPDQTRLSLLFRSNEDLEIKNRSPVNKSNGWRRRIARARPSTALPLLVEQALAARNSTSLWKNASASRLYG